MFERLSDLTLQCASRQTQNSQIGQVGLAGRQVAIELFPGLAEDELRKQSLPVAIVAEAPWFTQQAVDHLAVVEMAFALAG